MQINHLFVSAKGDGADTTLVQPTDWNDNHVIIEDGWISAGETWTYASATTFTVPTDLTTKYAKGTKIKLTQTTAKYFYVTASSYGAPNTTVTITGGTDYSLANAAITLPFYSYAVMAQGFPDLFNYTPVWTSSGVAPSIGNGTLTGIFKMAARTVTVEVFMKPGGTTTFGTGTYYWSIPVADVGTVEAWIGGCRVQDSGTGWISGITVVDKDDHKITGYAYNIGPFAQTVPMTWAVNDTLDLQVSYEI